MCKFLENFQCEALPKRMKNARLCKHRLNFYAQNLANLKNL